MSEKRRPCTADQGVWGCTPDKCPRDADENCMIIDPLPDNCPTCGRKMEVVMGTCTQVGMNTFTVCTSDGDIGKKVRGKQLRIEVLDE